MYVVRGSRSAQKRFFGPQSWAGLCGSVFWRCSGRPRSRRWACGAPCPPGASGRSPLRQALLNRPKQRPPAQGQALCFRGTGRRAGVQAPLRLCCLGCGSLCANSQHRAARRAKHANNLPGTGRVPARCRRCRRHAQPTVLSTSAAPRSAAYLIRLPAARRPGLSGSGPVTPQRAPQPGGTSDRRHAHRHSCQPWVRARAPAPGASLWRSEQLLVPRSRAGTSQLLVHPMWALRGRLLGARQSTVGLPSYPQRPTEQRQTGSPRPHAPHQGCQAAAQRMECAVCKVPPRHARSSYGQPEVCFAGAPTRPASSRLDGAAPDEWA